MNLFKSNPTDLIKSTTQEAFTSIEDDKDAMKALKTLTKLRGIGPATASLLLSVYSPEEVPFFSDELFRWTHWDSPGKTGWLRSIKYNVTEYKEILASIEELTKRLGVKAVDAEKVAYVLGKEKVELESGVESEEDAKVVLKEKFEDSKAKETRVEGATAEAHQSAKRKRSELKEEEEIGDDSNKTSIEKAKKRGGKAGTAKIQDDAVQKAAKSAQRKGKKRETQEEQPPAEGTRRSTRRKA